MEKREYGSTGERLSIVGFGGILVSQVDAGEASGLVAEAVDRGVDYFDVAPTYGNAQEMLGPALEPYRKDVFLACKTTERTAAGARRELEESLRLLRTDHVDLYQLHAVNTAEDFDAVTGPGGALELFRQARERGMTRYLGFSSHSSETALRLIEAVDFDSVLFPVNWCTWLGAGFGPAVVAAAETRGTARLALKALARGKLTPGRRPQVVQVLVRAAGGPGAGRLGLALRPVAAGHRGDPARGAGPVPHGPGDRRELHAGHRGGGGPAEAGGRRRPADLRAGRLSRWSRCGAGVTFAARAISSAGQSACLTSRRSPVRAGDRPPYFSGGRGSQAQAPRVHPGRDRPPCREFPPPERLGRPLCLGALGLVAWRGQVELPKALVRWGPDGYAFRQERLLRNLQDPVP